MAETQKKLFYKKWWFWVIIVIIIVAIASQGRNGNTTKEVAGNEMLNPEDAEPELEVELSNCETINKN